MNEVAFANYIRHVPLAAVYAAMDKALDNCAMCSGSSCVECDRNAKLNILQDELKRRA